MGSIDEQDRQLAQEQWEAMAAEYRKSYPQANIEAITFNAIAQHKIANVSGVPLERLSWQTRARGLRLFFDSQGQSEPRQPDTVIEVVPIIELNIGLL